MSRPRIPEPAYGASVDSRDSYPASPPAAAHHNGPYYDDDEPPAGAQYRPPQQQQQHLPYNGGAQPPQQPYDPYGARRSLADMSFFQGAHIIIIIITDDDGDVDRLAWPLSYLNTHSAPLARHGY